ADEHEVEPIGKRLHDGRLALLDLVGEIKVREVIPQNTDSERRREFGERGPMNVTDRKEIDQRQHEHDERHDKAEKQKGDQRRLSAMPGARELVARIGGFEDVGEIEPLQCLLHEADGLGAQRGTLLKGGVMAGAQFLAPFRNRLEPFGERRAFHHRQAERDDGGEGHDGGGRGRYEVRIEQYLEDADAQQGAPQNLKLSILRITAMPIDIHTAQPTSMRLPIRSWNSSMM